MKEAPVQREKFDHAVKVYFAKSKLFMGRAGRG